MDGDDRGSVVHGEERRADLTRSLLRLVRERIPAEDRACVEAIARQYYSTAPTEDIVEYEVPDLYGALVAHWDLARHRGPGETLVRVFTPTIERHGWTTPHTVVEVVSDDMPFLLDSLTVELDRQGLEAHFVTHPVVSVRRDGAGTMVEVWSTADHEEADDEEADGEPDGFRAESLIHVEIDRISDTEVLRALEGDLERVLRDVRVAVGDWQPMRQRLFGALDELQRRHPGDDAGRVEELEEVCDFLRWVAADHFTFVGYRAYEFADEGKRGMLRGVPGTSLGILRHDDDVTSAETDIAQLPSEGQEEVGSPRPLLLTKANKMSTVHRPATLDHVGVWAFDDEGRVAGEHRFIGLFTASAYRLRPEKIPIARRKVEWVLERAAVKPGSHDAKALANVLDRYPRDELLQIPVEDLYENVMSILHLAERRRVRLFAWRDPFGRYWSCHVHLPADLYDTGARQRIAEILLREFNGTSIECTARMAETVLARLDFEVRVALGGPPPRLGIDEIEAQIVSATRPWAHELHRALAEFSGEEDGNRLHRRYVSAFPAGYRSQIPARNAVFDIRRIEGLTGDDGLGMVLYQPIEAPEQAFHFKLFRRDHPIVLSHTLPMLENMGVTVVGEQPFEVAPSGDSPVYIHDFTLRHDEPLDLAVDEVRDLFQNAFAHTWRGVNEDDSFNALVLRARLSWRDIRVLRVYAEYLRQSGVNFSQAYMAQALVENPHVTRLLVRVFRTRMGPGPTGEARAGEAEGLTAELEAALDEVPGLDADRILRRFLAAIQATTRTNFFQTTSDGEPKGHLALKFDPSRLDHLPEPRPMHEVFVSSPEMAGVHLRGGPTARGGIRWSDRREDFRTEVHGLMKAQTVKNTIIVPVGAKGGFVVKRPRRGEGGGAHDAVDCYRTFVRGMLDITDNRVGGAVVPPPDVIRHDGDDPYLVVAADKGTAGLSDVANEVAREYDFWLGDAFASGGSTGYDHKELGITSRGAWVSVRRHLWEAGISADDDGISVIGIGDMSGDVFGNGMLYSRNLRLLAAFDHRHIFFDPDPDPDRAFAERMRLFKQPESNWADYDVDALSEGGGVHSRTAKSIPLSPQVREALDVDATSLTPNGAIRAILRAPTDLLWFGGIGTYVKAGSESHAGVGDRACDGVRVDASELRCRIVGEGGNLGITQAGRIEAASGGVRLNTDFVDNSGGVDCSDHEVNIKIVLDEIVERGDLTVKQRSALLREMTDDVVDLVLADNHAQTQAISVSESQSPALLAEHIHMIRDWHASGTMDRDLEALPSEKKFAERRKRGQGLTRPELAVLLAQGKILLKEDLRDGDLADDPYLSGEIEAYLPSVLPDRFPEQVRNHRLRRQIINTRVTNAVMNRIGDSFHRLREETGASPSDIARCFIAVRDILSLRTLWAEIDDLGTTVPPTVETDMLVATRRILVRMTARMLRILPQPIDLDGTVRRFSPGASLLWSRLPQLVASTNNGDLGDDARLLVKAGVPEALAERLAVLGWMLATLDIVEVAEASGRPVDAAGLAYYRLGARLDLPWLHEQIGALPAETHWQVLARAALRDELLHRHRVVTAAALELGDDEMGEEDDVAALIDRWLADRENAIARCRRICDEIRAMSDVDIAILSVALRELQSL